MASITPSSDKVDTFLSNISTLSQERLKEDQERERLLQRNIDELRFSSRQGSPHKSSTLGLSHSAAYDRIEDGRLHNPLGREMSFKQTTSETPPPKPKRPPQLPSRPSGAVADNKKAPSLPRRRNQDELTYEDNKSDDEDAPPLPRRKGADPISFDINLIQPIARSDVSRNAKLAKSPEPIDRIVGEPQREKNVGLRSFLDMESDIKLGDINTKELGKISKESKEINNFPLSGSQNGRNKEVSSPSDKPNKAPKPSYLAFSAKNSSPSFEDDSKNMNKSKVIAAPEISTTGSSKKAFGSLGSTPIIENKKEPKISPENKTSSSVSKADKIGIGHSQERKSFPLKNAPPKPTKPPLKNFVEKDEEFLKNLKNNLGRKPPKPGKPSSELQTRKNHDDVNDTTHNKKPDPIPEALAQMNKIRSVPAPSSQSTDIKKDNTITGRSTLSQSSSDLSGGQPLRAQLSSVLKAKSFPLSNASVLSTPQRSTKETEKKEDTPNVKLSHTNKQRSKGPRRKLPKGISKTPSKSATPVEVNTSQEDATKETKDEPDTKKTPPPVNKDKKPNFHKPLKARLEVGQEVFI
ncbi:Piso0_000654 [Millerozyma farinosa CBS 7064]|uniref:Piso0_000654 protein n=1 Tax=Pichia sorbitophila (strain ATCC MYA-4447 / BCRC 22081 / CBS 7064 / NBRC 10061 / NRRL Y-12695) TaxID=559304 RepID=G8YR54_PICSO|nr:Piso0_000654 [Millerozyma farinosa CBS 7064]